MKSIVLVDGNPLIWRAFYAVGLEYDGVTKGIVSSISKIIEQFKCGYDNVDSSILVFWDSGKSRWRRKVYPDYKLHREAKKEKIDIEGVYKQRDAARAFIKNMGIRQIWVKGVEADDLIAWFATYFQGFNLYDKIVISTTDKDIWQLINDNTSVYDPINKEIIDEMEVKQRLGITPLQIPDWKALAGDVSDNIKGVNGIGDKTAVELIKSYGGVTGILDPTNHEAIVKYKRTASIIDHMEHIGFEYGLTRLSEFSEMKWYLNEDESNELVYSMFKKVQRDRLGVQLMKEKFQSVSSVQGSGLSLPSEVLTGIKAFVGKKEQEEYSSLASLDQAILYCTKCSLREGCGDYGPTLAEGFSDVEIMVIGRNPGEDELKGGRPFIGKAGKRLDQFLLEVGLTRREIWVTNVCKCYSKNNRPLTHGEVMACSGYLQSEIDLIKPKFILAFGNEAMSLVTPYGSGVTKHCGEIMVSPNSLLLEKQIMATVAVCVHPSSALRSVKYETEMQYATKTVKEFLEGKRC